MHDGVGAGSARHRSSPSNTPRYFEVNWSVRTAAVIAVWISSLDGHTSRRNTSRPSVSCPSGSVVRSTVIRPARA
mgnify:CR=1 FL=1